MESELITQLITSGGIGIVAVVLIGEKMAGWMVRLRGASQPSPEAACPLTDGGIGPGDVGQLRQQWDDHLKGQATVVELLTEIRDELRGLRAELNPATDSGAPVREAR